MDYKIEVEFKGEVLKGILIKEDNDFLTIKLSSGYNANLKKSEIKIISKEKQDKKEILKKEGVKNKNLPKITIIHTGGTIASKVDYKTGAVSSKFTPQELLNIFPELDNNVNINAKMIGNMASDDMRFEHYNIMIDEINNAIKNEIKGIIISHGTDTLHYTSAALNYALKNLPIPVILVGAQRSSDRPSSDAYSNLNAAVDFIIENSRKDKSFRRVGICMHDSLDDESFVILDSINAKKMHSSRRDAFKQINYLPFAKIKNSKIEILRNDLLSEIGEFDFVKYDTTLKIGFLKIHPHMYSFEVDNYRVFDAVIIEGTGLGHMPISEIDIYTKEHLNILNSIKNLVKSGVKVIVGVQTVYGMTNLNVYSPGRILNSMGIYGNFMNLTTESLFIRTAYCLSCDKNKFNEIWNSNLEGFELKSIEIENE